MPSLWMRKLREPSFEALVWILDRACLCFQEDDRVRAACERREADTSAGLRRPALDPDLSLVSAPAPAAAS